MPVRLTALQARSLGLRPPTKPRPEDGMNRTERDFAGLLDAALARRAIAAWWREPLAFRLAGRCRYTPDFLVRLPGPMDSPDLWAVEVKGGYVREDSIVKLKVAAELYPFFAWLIVFRERRGWWKAYRVTSRGIDVNRSVVPWIHGGGYE